MWVLKHKPDMNISVRGYTDSRGSHSYNRALAKRRARSVKKYLIQHGIGKKRIIIDPIGELLPLLKEVTKADMATNRRVEMLLINNHLTPIPCIYLSHELKEKVRIKKIIDRDVYCSLWNQKMTWNPGIVFSSDLTRLTEKDELKLKANIHVLKEHPDYLISIDDTITYKIIVKNIGAIKAVDVEIEDFLPEGTAFVEDSIVSMGDYQGSQLDDGSNGVNGALPHYDNETSPKIYAEGGNVNTTGSWRLYPCVNQSSGKNVHFATGKRCLDSKSQCCQWVYF
jgi:uncharacterized repeat protein (TIGR01451 family)